MMGLLSLFAICSIDSGAHPGSQASRFLLSGEGIKNILTRPTGARNQHPIIAFRTTGPTRLPRKEAYQRILSPDFLRRQAENCLRIARSCFDLASAERLRLMAAELNAKAAEMDDNKRQDQWPRVMERSPSS